uniref:RING-type E3 ubiquitin transferase n=1 Tax=Hordeum vulgare subsp. vulgare TaxID=112509 RepID=A0A8I6YGB0_HORVV
MSDSSSTALQYTGIGAFVAIVLLGLVYFGRTVITGRRHDVHTGHEHDTASASPGQLLGLAPDDIAVLPTFTYLAASPGRWGGGGKAKAVGADSCAVCLEELREGAVVRMLPSCKHYFHASCVDVWLLSHATCPVCRASPALEKVRLGAVSMSPPLPQLRPYGGSPKGGDGVSRFSSPPTQSELCLHVSNAHPVILPSPTRPTTPDSRMFRSSSPSPATADLYLAEAV